MKQLTPEEAKAKIKEALKRGAVTFANPKAASISIRGPEEKGFTYVEATVLPPFKTRKKAKKPYEHAGGIHFQWGKQGFGFGEVSMVLRNGVWAIDTEGLGPDFLKEVLCAWVDKGNDRKFKQLNAVRNSDDTRHVEGENNG